MKNMRRYYQVFFLALFFVLLGLAAQGRIRGYLVTLFLDSSALNGIGTLLSARNVAHTMWIGFAVFALTFLFGRFFCGWICPLGTIFHGMSYLMRPKKTKDAIARNEYSSKQAWKYILLVILLIGAGMGILQIGLFDPISLLTRTGATFLHPGATDIVNTVFYRAPERAFGMAPVFALIFILLLLLNAVRPRFWCRYICPLGALLGLAGKCAPGAVIRDEGKCTNCRKCTKVCPAACDPETKTRTAECYVCFNCTEECPEDALAWSWKVSSDAVQKDVDVSRRSFITSVACGFAGFVGLRLSGITLFRGYPKRIRPPGSLGENEFLARCLKCGECMKVCPTNVLQPSLHESGLEAVWTPVLDMNRGYCELNCTLCSQVCPSGAIRRISTAQKHGLDGQGPIRIGSAFVDRSRCIPWSSGKKCVVCEEVCPVSPKAIYKIPAEVQIEDKMVQVTRPQVIPERCIGCGICEHECPIRDVAGIRVTAAGETRDPDRSFIL